MASLTPMPRVLVCGSRNYRNYPRVEAVLTAFRRVHGVAVVIEGGAEGADYFGFVWAYYRQIATIREDAEWRRYGPAAGPIRNQKMLDVHHPDVIIRFNGHKGSADMRERALAAGLPVLEGDIGRPIADVINEYSPDSRLMTA